jgi:hypothetical protein
MTRTRNLIATRTALLVRSELGEKRIFGVLTVCLSLLLLVGCTSTQSAKFKDAGCIAADEFNYDEAEIQFDLAAVNGDNGAVAAAIASRRIMEVLESFAYGGLSYRGIFDPFVEDVSAFCGSGYDIVSQLSVP